MARMMMQRSGTEVGKEDPVAVLYEGVLRSLSRAKQCIWDGDQIGRVVEVRKVTDILTCMQAILRTELGRSAATSLSDFYAGMFTLTLEASECESTEGLDEVIGHVSQVRDAWMLSKSKLKPGRTTIPMVQSYPMHAGTMLFQA